MTTNTPININDFCAAPSIYIPTFDDSGSETWFILTKKIIQALDLPDDAEMSELLGEAAYRTEMPANAQNKSDAWHFVTERGLYDLIFMSEAPAFQRFRDWALHVVLPIALIDAYYVSGEEQFFLPPPRPARMDGVDLEELLWLTSEVLPEIRRDGGYMSIEHVLELKQCLKRDDAIEIVSDYLWDLKGHRSRKHQRLH